MCTGRYNGGNRYSCCADAQKFTLGIIVSDNMSNSNLSTILNKLSNITPTNEGDIIEIQVNTVFTYLDCCQMIMRRVFIVAR